MADDDIDYQAEGDDEAVRSGPNRYGVPEGEGGVFGTTGSSTSPGGFHVRGVTRKTTSS